MRQLLARPSPDDGLARLTERERLVLAWLAEGTSNRAIADEFFLALCSVEKNISSIFQKLDVPAATTDHRRGLAVLRYLHSFSS